MKIRITQLSVLLALVALTATAHAGRSSLSEVVITRNEIAGTANAHGAVADARSSADIHQSIGCIAVRYETAAFGFCDAVASDGSSVACTSTNEEQLRMMESVNAMTQLEFGVKADGTCEYIVLYQNSSNLN